MNNDCVHEAERLRYEYGKVIAQNDTLLRERADMSDKLRAAESKLAEVEAALTHVRGHVVETGRKLQQAEAKLAAAEAREAGLLREYAEHKPECPQYGTGWTPRSGEPCSCGLTTLLKGNQP